MSILASEVALRRCPQASARFRRFLAPWPNFVLIRGVASCYQIPRTNEMICGLDHKSEEQARMATSEQKKIVSLTQTERETLLSRAAESGLNASDVERIREVFESYAYVSLMIQNKDLTMARLRKMLFGDSTESSANVLGTEQFQSEVAAAPSETATTSESDGVNSNAGKTRRGHGRNGAKNLPGATRVSMPIAGLQAGAECPACGTGQLYEISEPGVLIRFVGNAPVRATIYELQKLRCQLCGKVFTADPPAEAGSRKYDPTVGSLVGMLKYGYGFPFHRLAQMQDHLDVPLAASTQWEIVSLATDAYEPVYNEFLRQAAQGELFMNDDTNAKILAWMGKRRARTVAALAAAEASAKSEAESSTSLGHENDERDALETSVPSLDRKGMYTTGILAETGGNRIALFFTGRRHAGDNLGELLKRRAEGLSSPMQMCDALSRNYPSNFQTIVGNCLVHARRKFVDAKNDAFAECKRVLTALAEVYAVDDRAKREQLTPEARLLLHQQLSGPVMEGLREWLKEQIEQRLVEPNSGVGAAIEYMRRHWTKLTLFLRVPGAPLDNNAVERALKKAILHRKNALFYKTDRGALVGDIHMSLIHTCELCDANASDYLTALQQHATAVKAAPGEWLPWNYRDAITSLAASS